MDVVTPYPSFPRRVNSIAPRSNEVTAATAPESVASSGHLYHRGVRRNNEPRAARVGYVVAAPVLQGGTLIGGCAFAHFGLARAYEAPCVSS
jgi:hypothetical protein